mgnify:CR=1 FL=1
MVKLKVTLFICLFSGILTGCSQAQESSWQNAWLTPEQQGQRLYTEGNYAAAAQRYTDSMRIGAAWYRAGEFERAAAAFGQRSSAQAHFNRGNALIMLGQYEQAIAAFDLALEQRQDWQPAIENQALARIRLARLAPAEDDAGGTGGMLEADEIVFDTTGRVNKSETEQTVDADGGLTDTQLRELWLRRVATRPADFLRARFAVQFARQSESSQ